MMSKPIAIWENADTTAAFSAQSLTVDSLDNYNFFIAWPVISNASVHQCGPVILQSENGEAVTGRWSDTIVKDSAAYRRERRLTITPSSGTIDFQIGYLNGATDSNALVPRTILAAKI